MRKNNSYSDLPKELRQLAKQLDKVGRTAPHLSKQKKRRILAGIMGKDKPGFLRTWRSYLAAVVAALLIISSGSLAVAKSRPGTPLFPIKHSFTKVISVDNQKNEQEQDHHKSSSNGGTGKQNEPGTRGSIDQNETSPQGGSDVKGTSDDTSGSRSGSSGSGHDGVDEKSGTLNSGSNSSGSSNTQICDGDKIFSTTVNKCVSPNSGSSNQNTSSGGNGSDH